MATPNLGFQNFYTTTLSSGITATDTTIYLNSLPTPTEGYLVIEPDSSTNKEIIYYTSKGANFVTLPSIAAGRGVGATTAVSHNTGVTCQMNVVAEHFEALQDGTAFAVGGIGATAYADGWTPILGSTPNTVTYNGNRNYDLVFNSVDLTSTLSPGMRLKATRTVAAPSQCTDLESSSSQYYSKTSPAGMTFTDDFTVSAWVKLESYPAAGQMIMARYNGTSGWYFRIGPSGTVVIAGLNGGSSNESVCTSYASLPLNKWVHVAAQLDMSTFTATTTTSYIMIDGVDVSAAVTRTGTNPTALIQAGNLEIGSFNGGTQPFDGKIAQVAIYSAKVTQATIKASCNQTLSGSETSLISAYSFNGVITDLNTTNANNLTAQGSAVATNADSPFANAVTAGLLEYAEVNSVTFSTNTTVNVRVPDSSLLPTSGGVSAMSYATTANPYGLPFFTKILAYVRATASFTTTIAGADISGLTSTVYVHQNGTIKISLWVGRVTNVSGAGVETTANLFSDGVTDIGANGPNVNNSASAGPISLSYIRTPTVGNHTYKFQGQNSGSNTGVTFSTGAYLTIELI